MARAAPLSALVLSSAVLLGLLAPRSALARELRLGDTLSDLASALASAGDGDEIVVPRGVWPGVAVVERTVTIRGEAGAVLTGDHRGTVIEVRAPDVVIRDVEIRGSGIGMENPRTNVDACVWSSPRAERLEVRGSHFVDCLFGIYVQQSDGARIIGNHVVGRSDLREADRGNGIHVFDADHVLIEDNEVEGARDGLYISSTDDSQILGNRIHHVRYAVHYMWSHRNVLSGNEATSSLAGFALMQSHDLLVEHNRLAQNERAGLLARDGQRCVYRGNDLVENGTGAFVYNSLGERFEANTIAHNDVGVRMWGALVVGGVFERNSFVGNAQQIFYFSNRDMRWGEGSDGNHFSDYLGWDQDDDGVGDRPYCVDSLTATLVHRFPAAALLLRSPALELIAHLQAGLPVLRVATVTDVAPRTEPTTSLDVVRLLGSGRDRSRAVSVPADPGDTSMPM